MGSFPSHGLMPLLAGLLLAGSGSATALEVDLRLFGYVYHPEVTLRGTTDRLELVDQAGGIVGFDRQWTLTLAAPEGRVGTLHECWLRTTHGGGRGHLLFPTWLWAVVAGGCVVVDALLVARWLRRQRGAGATGRTGAGATADGAFTAGS